MRQILLTLFFFCAVCIGYNMPSNAHKHHHKHHMHQMDEKPMKKHAKAEKHRHMGKHMGRHAKAEKHMPMSGGVHMGPLQEQIAKADQLKASGLEVAAAQEYYAIAHKYDKKHKLEEAAKYYDIAGELYLGLFEQAVNSGHSPLIRYYADKAAHIASRISEHDIAGELHLVSSETSELIGDYDKAIGSIDKAINIADQKEMGELAAELKSHRSKLVAALPKKI